MSIRISTGTLLLGVLSVCCLMAPPVAAQQPTKPSAAKQSAQAPAEGEPKFTPEQQKQLDQANELLSQVRRLSGQGKYRDAIPLAAEILKLREAVLADEDVNIAVACSWLGFLTDHAGNAAAALPLYKRALKIREIALGPDHLDVAVDLSNLALLYRKQGNNAEALPLFLRALKIREKALGPNHLDVAESLNSVAVLYNAHGKFADALPLSQRVLKIREQALAPNHPDLAESLYNLAVLYKQQGKYADALPLYQRALKIREQAFGPDHPKVAESLGALGVLNDAQGKYADALPFFERALKIREKSFGPDHPEVANSLSNLAAGYLYQGKNTEALPLLQRTLKINETALGSDHPDVAHTLSLLASAYNAQGKFADALPLLQRALKIDEKALGPDRSEVADIIFKLAALNQSQGKYAEAIALNQRSLKIQEQALGPDHPDVAFSLNNLAGLNQTQGNYAEALPLFERALKIRLQVLGPDHPDIAFSLNGLALLSQAQGNYADALPLFQRALQIRETALGPDHPEVANSLGSLAMLYKEQHNYAAALPLQQRSLQILETAYGPNHHEVAENLNNLALLYQMQGRYDAALPLFQRSLKIDEKVFGADHPVFALALHNVAMLYQMQGNYAEALPLYQRSLKIWETALGPDHRDVAAALNNLAWLLDWMGDDAQAEPLLYRALTIFRGHLERAAVAQSERQQLLMANDLRLILFYYLSVAGKAKVPAEKVYAEVLACKGAVSARQQAMRQLRGEQQDPKVSVMYAQLADTARQLDGLSRAAPKPDQAETYRHDLAELNETFETLQQQLAGANGDYRRQLDQQHRTPADVQSALPTNTALVDLLEYRHFDPPPAKGQDEISEQRLAAFVVRPGQPVQWIELGPTKPIGDAVDRWRKSYSAADGAELRRLVWQPLETKIAGAKTVLVSPDGPLDRFPLAALPGEKEGTYLIEEVAIATVPISRLLPEILRSDGAAKTSPSLLLVGGVDFGADPGRVNPGVALDRSAVRGNGPVSWPPLPGTVAEVAAIKRSFAQLKAKTPPIELTGAAATKSAVRSQLGNCRYVHLSTHGFFAPPQVRSALDRSGSAENQNGLELVARQGVTGYHPDLMSGLVLAGANRPSEEGQEDGILTALEVGQLDLSHVELATLSACETGLGAAAGGEGVLGLQRAFQLAGAKSVVAGLWKVPDQATQLLMARFYDNLWQKKMSKLEALRQAQLWLLNDASKQAGLKRGLELDAATEATTQAAEQGNRLPPYYWAAFELSGDWR